MSELVLLILAIGALFSPAVIGLMLLVLAERMDGKARFVISRGRVRLRSRLRPRPYDWEQAGVFRA